MQWLNTQTKSQLAKKTICTFLAVLMIFSLSACTSRNQKEVSLYDLNKAMADVAGFAEMKYVSSLDSNAEDLFENISSMEYSKVQGFFINYAVNGTGNADEIACIQVKNENDAAEAVSSLQKHLNKRIGLYSSYDKSQLDKLNSAVITKYGNVAVLIVGDKAVDMEKAFNSFFSEK